MSKKVALLIGVSEYGEGIPSLSAPPNDVVAVERVLKDPKMGGFDRVRPLINPDLRAMQTAIARVFRSLAKEDLVLLFFSGHGITDDNNRLYLTSKGTAKDVYKATSVPASFVQDISQECYAKRQVIILDCCYSGAFAEGWQAKSVGLDLQKELGAEGRVVLTSSSATQTSFQQEDAELSLYTQYWVQGIATGAADIDGDGEICARELHDYAKKKVQEAKPKQKPEIISDKEGYNILLSLAPVNDPELLYRQEVEKYVTRGKGKISIPAKKLLRKKRQDLQVSEEKAKDILNEVLAPYRQHRENIEEYRTVFLETVAAEYPLSNRSLEDLQDFQDYLGLEDKDIAEFKEKTLAEREAERQAKQPEPQEEENKPQEEGQEEVKLLSKKGINYTHLRDLLAAGKWREADEETANKMLEVAGRTEEGYLEIEDVDNFPCEDLRTIDRLWVKYSDGRFGFSVQARIYRKLGGTREYDEKIWEAFGDRVGWRREGEWLLEPLTYNYHKKAAAAHFPRLIGFDLVCGEFWPIEARVSLAQRLVACRITSEKGIDYTHLRDFLAAGRWTEADEETYKKMLEVAGRTEKGWLDEEDIDNFPCDDLLTIDRLWVKYSDGRFGFSVQARIYWELGGTREYDREIWKAFGDRVDWRREGEWIIEFAYERTAPQAHLPSPAFLRWRGYLRWLFSRAKTCSL